MGEGVMKKEERKKEETKESRKQNGRKLVDGSKSRG